MGRWAALVVLLCGGFAFAQQCTYELEPNDQVESATAVTGAGPESLAPASLSEVGASCLSGALASGDTDVYLWTPSETEAGHRWVVGLEGDGGQSLSVTLAAATVAANGRDVTGMAELLTVASADGSQASSAEFLVNSGTT